MRKILIWKNIEGHFIHNAEPLHLNKAYILNPHSISSTNVCLLVKFNILPDSYDFYNWVQSFQSPQCSLIGALSHTDHAPVYTVKVWHGTRGWVVSMMSIQNTGGIMTGGCPPSTPDIYKYKTLGSQNTAPLSSTE